jgi:integrase
MPKMKLTALAVARIAPPVTGQVDYFDTAMPAFGLRVSLAGSRTYFAMTRVHGKLVRLTIGKAKIKDDDVGLSLKEAREKAGQWVDLAARGIDPRQLKTQERQDNQERASNTFKTVGERFMRQHVEPRLAPATRREYRLMFDGKDVAPWADKPVSSISRADVRAVLDAMVERGSPSMANNTLAYLRKFFNWCAEKDLIDIPPTDRMKPPAPKTVGERTLNEAEIVEVWRAFEAKGDAFRDLFKLLLLTGQRRSEVGGMSWAELSGLDGDRAAWEIPRERTKNSRPHLVPLAPPAVAIIEAMPVIGDAGLLFTTTGATPISGFSKAKERVDAWIADERRKAGRAPMPDWTIHDLRRTMVTMMNERLGIAPHVVEACVNHISGGAKAGVAGVYNKALYLNERREALYAWAAYLTTLVGKSPPLC